jgi:glucose-6-phosphate 1-epimerase
MPNGDAPYVDITHTDGASARVYLDGAQVTSWIPAGSSDDRLFVSRNAYYGAGTSIRGGIPICFPQFGVRGPLRQHGFARMHRWAVLRQSHHSDGARAVFVLGDSNDTRADWPFAFKAELCVRVAAQTLTVELSVSNTDTQPFEFTAALHPYFATADAYATRVNGLNALTYRDALRHGDAFVEDDSSLHITGHIDRIYVDAPDLLEIVEPHRRLRIGKRGFPDAVVWNPGADITANKPDFAAGDERLMLCVEAGAIMSPVRLAPGEQWSGSQVMTAVP